MTTQDIAWTALGVLGLVSLAMVGNACLRWIRR